MDSLEATTKSLLAHPTLIAPEASMLQTAPPIARNLSAPEAKDLAFLHKHDRGLLFVLKSHTEEKGKHFEYIANYIHKNTGFPLYALLLRTLDLHASPVEDGLSAEANAIIKGLATKASERELRDPKTPAHLVLRKVMKGHGIKYDANDLSNVVMFSEDSTQGPRVEIVNAFRELLLDNGVAPELLTADRFERAEHNGKQYALLTDYGMIISAIGAQKYYQLMGQAALKSGHGENDTVDMLDNVSIHWHLLSDSEHMPERKNAQFSLQVPVQLHAPLGLSNIAPAGRQEFVVPRNYLTNESAQGQALAANPLGYLVTESFRREAIIELMKRALDAAKNAISPAVSNDNVTSTLDGQAALHLFNISKNIITPAHPRIMNDPMVVAVTPGRVPGPHKGITVRQYTPQTVDDAMDVFAMEFNGRVPDLTIVPAYTPQTVEDRIRFVASIDSLEVSIQTDPRVGPAIWFNINGCHDWKRLGANRLTNLGYNGNFHRDLAYERGMPEVLEEVRKAAPGVTVTADRYGIYLNGNNESEIHQAYYKLAPALLRNRVRSSHKPDADRRLGNYVECPRDLVRGAVYMSANHYHTNDASIAVEIGTTMAKNNMPLTWGAMDKLPASGMVDAYVAHNGPHLTGSSTSDLLVMETATGRLDPRIKDGYVRRNIATRMVTDLTRPQNFVVALRGGIGTEQEDAVALWDKQNLIVYEPALAGAKRSPRNVEATGSSLVTLLGDDNAARLVRSHDSLFAEHGILLATSLSEAESYMKQVGRMPRRHAQQPQRVSTATAKIA